MSTLAERVMAFIKERPGLTDREISDVMFGPRRPQQPVNSTCRTLVSRGQIERRRRPDGLIGNYPSGTADSQATPRDDPLRGAAQALSEDRVKEILERWLRAQGWESKISWGRTHGIDVAATRGSEKWIIEAKGGGSRSEMRVNYFLGVIGETLQRMDDPDARYSIALPDHEQYRRLWRRLPRLAKSRTRITALFVSGSGHVTPEQGGTES